MTRFLFFLLLSFPVISHTQTTIHVGDTLKYRIGLTSRIWDTLCVSSGTVSNSEDFTVWTGTLNYNPNAVFTFSLCNDSLSPLIISRAYWGEPNFEPKWSGELIEKGKAGKLTYICHTNLRSGIFSKNGVVSTNRGEVKIHFRGNVLPPYLHLDKNISIVKKKSIVEADFTISHRSFGEDTLGFKVDSVNTDSFTKLIYNTSIAGPNDSITFHIKFKPDGKLPTRSQVFVYINGTAVEHDLFTVEKRRRKK